MFETRRVVHKLKRHKDCYYCHKRVITDYAWNASDDGEEYYRCHGRCMDREKNQIVLTRDWARGEAYSRRHVLLNPLEDGEYVAKCGCKLGLIRTSRDGNEYSAAVMDGWCMKHTWIHLQLELGGYKGATMEIAKKHRKALIMEFLKETGSRMTISEMKLLDEIAVEVS